MAWWAWAGFILVAVAGWVATDTWRRRQQIASAARFEALLAERQAAIDEARSMAGTSGRALDHVAAQHADLQRVHALALRDWQAESAALRTDLALSLSRLHVSEDRVHALTTITECVRMLEQARTDWKDAYEQSARTVGAFDALLQQHYAHIDQPIKTPLEGWRLVITDAAGTMVSIRRVRDDKVPLRISRGHGAITEWYRLTRLEAMSLIYTPEVMA